MEVDIPTPTRESGSETSIRLPHRYDKCERLRGRQIVHQVEQLHVLDVSPVGQCLCLASLEEEERAGGGESERRRQGRRVGRWDWGTRRGGEGRTTSGEKGPEERGARREHGKGRRARCWRRPARRDLRARWYRSSPTSPAQASARAC
eukprot:746178-Hanusia_phi.AAC.6